MTPVIIGKNYRHKASGQRHRLVARHNNSDVIPGADDDFITVETNLLTGAETHSWLGGFSDFVREFELL